MMRADTAHTTPAPAPTRPLVPTHNPDPLGTLYPAGTDHTHLSTVRHTNTHLAGVATRAIRPAQNPKAHVTKPDLLPRETGVEPQQLGDERLARWFVRSIHDVVVHDPVDLAVPFDGRRRPFAVDDELLGARKSIEQPVKAVDCISWPLEISAIRSLNCSASAMSCVVSRIDVSQRISARQFQVCRFAPGSSAVDGSSRSSNFGRVASAMQISTRLW